MDRPEQTHDMPPVLDYRSPGTSDAVRPPWLMSHCRTAAFLCLLAVATDWKLIEIRQDTGSVPCIAWILAIYGFTAAIVNIAHGVRRWSDKLWLVLCCTIYVLTTLWGFRPIVNHN
jgi:hypothetical protein